MIGLSNYVINVMIKALSSTKYVGCTMLMHLIMCAEINKNPTKFHGS